MKNTQQWRDRLGYYLVGNKKFFNKPLALIEHKITREDVKWVFNDSAYDTIDWSIPIQTSLPELYRQRAQQLRDDYDYLVLYFSGGADSLNVLHAFIDNNIFLDEIVLQYPKSVEQTFNDKDKSSNNIYSEVKYSAIPLLNSLDLHPNTVIRHQDITKPLLELLQHDNWFDTNPMGTNFTIAGVARQAAQVSESHILELCNRGKQVAQILGIDKPMVWFDGKNYYAYFLDVNAMHSPPVELTQKEIYTKFYHAEFFYWTPDLPEIVVKQAQEIKKLCEKDPASRKMIADSSTHIFYLKPVIHPVIYLNQTKIEFETRKPESKIIRGQDSWFWNTADQTITTNYLNVIKYLDNNIESYHKIGGDLMNGIQGTKSKLYKL